MIGGTVRVDELDKAVYSGSQSVRVDALAYDQAETSRGLTRYT
jgi:hypothetical protein